MVAPSWELPARDKGYQIKYVCLEIKRLIYLILKMQHVREFELENSLNNEGQIKDI